MIEKYQSEIEKGISELKLPNQPKDLYEPICYFLSLGGKRMRPVLVLMAHELFGGDYKKIISPAIAMELFHNFSLVHDDIMDNASLRRGKKTVHEKWNNNTAILSGDAILIEAYKLLSKSESKYLSNILNLFNQTATEVCEGQVYDMSFEKRNDVSIDEYIEMIRLKTAVLLGCCLKIGAILAGANEKDAQHIYDFGIHLGIAFQLHDDILDVYGDPEKFGKKVGGDIDANKKTFLFLKTLELVSPDDKLHLNNIISFNNEHKVEQVIMLYDKYKIRKLAEEEMQKQYSKAMEHLNFIAITDENKVALKTLAENLMKREY